MELRIIGRQTGAGRKKRLQGVNGVRCHPIASCFTIRAHFMICVSALVPFLKETCHGKISALRHFSLRRYRGLRRTAVSA
jgi:hypothetical protein